MLSAYQGYRCVARCVLDAVAVTVASANYRMNLMDKVVEKVKNHKNAVLGSISYHFSTSLGIVIRNPGSNAESSIEVGHRESGSTFLINHFLHTQQSPYSN
jgi:hypothetical protein